MSETVSLRPIRRQVMEPGLVRTFITDNPEMVMQPTVTLAPLARSDETVPRFRQCFGHAPSFPLGQA